MILMEIVSDVEERYQMLKSTSREENERERLAFAFFLDQILY